MTPPTDPHAAVVLRAAAPGGTRAGMTPSSRTVPPGRAARVMTTIIKYTVRGGRRWLP